MPPSGVRGRNTVPVASARIFLSRWQESRGAEDSGARDQNKLIKIWDVRKSAPG